MAIDIIPAEGKLLKEYIDFPHELYKEDPMYVPELYMAQKELFDRRKNPFFEHSQVSSFLAQRNGQTVGRISAIENKNYNKYHGCNIGFFGFFDFIDDYEVVQALLDVACDWCRDRNLDRILGPTNFSTNDTAGLLVEGFHEPPKIMMTYNKPYYQKHVERYGFRKEIDLYAYMVYSKSASEKSIRLAQTLEERLDRQGITFRPVNLKKFHEEVASIRNIYNEAWEKNWGFVPWTDGEMEHLANNLKMLVNREWCYMADHHGEPVGFSITLPDINELTRTFKKGRLFPFNILKLLWNKNKTKYVRILALGVKRDYRRKGIEAIFFAKNILQARKEGKMGGEQSWILENNQEMIASAERLNSDRYKTYRIYGFNLT